MRLESISPLLVCQLAQIVPRAITLKFWAPVGVSLALLDGFRLQVELRITHRAHYVQLGLLQMPKAQQYVPIAVNILGPAKAVSLKPTALAMQDTMETVAMFRVCRVT